ncbi:MAG: acetylxylan esterase [Armatimonadetes bacterium]|nr:acetylxylan esterase [Armatimonadota bacterium]
MHALFPPITTLVAAATADEDLTVLRPDPDQAPLDKLLETYLQRQVSQALRARREVVEALSSPEEVARRQQALRDHFVRSLGGYPERTPLNARVVSTQPGPGCRVERVIYESRPDHHVTAVAYVPDGTPPFPGVLIPCGHSANGKASENYQRVGILLAQNGILALCYDPIGQGERVQLLDDAGKPLMSCTAEHTMVGIGALLVGSQVAAYRIWDGIRSLDYLASRPDVDPQRLGCTGNSGGGTLTAYLMALDERVLAAAPSCYITSLERLFATRGPQDGEQNITGQVAFGMDHADYITMRAPKPTLVCVATKDFFDIHGAWETYREAKRIYGLIGHGERADIFEYGDGHGFSRPRRQAAMRWMRRWLLGVDDAPEEGDYPIFTDQELQCTRTGQVLLEFGGRSATELNIEREGVVAAERARFQAEHPGGAWLSEVRRLIALPDEIPAAKATRCWTRQRRGCELQGMTLESEPGILLPAVVFTPRARAPIGCVLHAHGEGKAAAAVPGGPIEQWVKEGYRVVAVDLRGMGETAASARPDRHHSKEAFLALHLARPLLGQRVYDLLSVLEWAADEWPAESARMLAVGVGSVAPMALHAAALEPRIGGVVLEGLVLSWKAVAHAPVSRDQLANAVPGALAVYDLTDLAASLAPRPLTLTGIVDPLGEPASPAAVNEAYAACREAYRRAGAPLRIELA